MHSIVENCQLHFSEFPTNLNDFLSYIHFLCDFYSWTMILWLKKSYFDLISLQKDYQKWKPIYPNHEKSLKNDFFAFWHFSKKQKTFLWEQGKLYLMIHCKGSSIQSHHLILWFCWNIFGHEILFDSKSLKELTFESQTISFRNVKSLLKISDAQFLTISHYSLDQKESTIFVSSFFALRSFLNSFFIIDFNISERIISIKMKYNLIRNFYKPKKPISLLFKQRTIKVFF